MAINGIRKVGNQVNVFDKIDKKKNPTDKIKTKDKVEISSEAKAKLKHKQEQEIGLLKLLTEETSEIREEKIQEVKERISKGYYNKENIKKEVASNLLDFFLP